MLTLVPDDWPIAKVKEYFDVTSYTVRKAKQLKSEHGILSVHNSYSRDWMSDEVKSKVCNFYENDSVSIG